MGRGAGVLLARVADGTDNVYQLAKKLKVKTAWGTDTLFDPELAKKQGKIVAKMQRWYAPHEILKMVTHDNAQLLKLSGPRDPYPGKLGVVEEGAYADLILVDGNPLETLDLVEQTSSCPGRSFEQVMEEQYIYNLKISDYARLCGRSTSSFKRDFEKAISYGMHNAYG